MFLNTIPFRYSINYKKQLNYNAELLRLFEQKILLQNYKEIPYGYIKSIIKKDIYNFIFNYVHFHIFEQNLENIEDINGYERTNIPFNLNVARVGNDKFNINFVAHDNYVDKNFLKYFTDCYKNTLSKILKNKNEFYLNEYNYKKIITKFNNTEKVFKQQHIIHKIFEGQVEEVSDRVAVVYEDRQITYGELNRRSNQLAHYLIRKYGVSGDRMVVLCLDRSEEMIIGILGVLKAGGGYVPIDPSYPEERIK